MPADLRLMAVLAHPDDESLGLAGVLPKYAAEGVEVSLVTGTRGERGRFGDLRAKDPGHPGPEKMGRIREAELRAAAETLGVRELAFLDYLDGELDRAVPTEAAAKIAAHIRRLRPQVVVTFPADGGYGHPDHIAISQLTMAAIVRAAATTEGIAGSPHAVSKLYHLVESQESWDLYQRVFKKLTATVDGVERGAVIWPEWAITTVIDARAHWSTAWKAVLCHQTQIANYEGIKKLSPEDQLTLWGWRRFYRSFSTVNGGREREEDLFEGLRMPHSVP